jgi:hypothetical protein
MDTLSGLKSINDSLVIIPTTGGKFTYTISCSGAGGTFKQSVQLVVPIPVLRSSYENKIAAGKVLGPVSLPSNVDGNARAFADFMQDGSYTVVVNTIKYNGNLSESQAVSGHIHFLKQVNNQWIDITNQLLTNNTGCIHPRKAMVADLNNDEKPDVVFACHGYDNIPVGQRILGEQQRVLLSQADGTYKNILLPTICYCHGGTVADVNGNGYAEIAYTDNIIRSKPFYLVNNRDGTFTEDTSRIPESASNHYIFSIEFIDFNSDGKYDLWVGGGNATNDTYSWYPTIYYNDGNNGYSDKAKIVLAIQSINTTSLDVIFENNTVYTLYVGNTYTTMLIEKYDFSTNLSMLVYSHTGNYNNGSPWFDWIISYNNNIVAADAKAY